MYKTVIKSNNKTVSQQTSLKKRYCIIRKKDSISKALKKQRTFPLTDNAHR